MWEYFSLFKHVRPAKNKMTHNIKENITPKDQSKNNIKNDMKNDPIIVENLT